MQGEVAKLTPYLTADLATDALLSHLAGSIGVVSRLPAQLLNLLLKPASGSLIALKTVHPVEGEVKAELPTLTEVLFPSTEPAITEVHLPALQSAVQALNSSPVKVGANYKETAKHVRDGAFAITTDMETKAVEDIRNELSKAIVEGKSQSDFIDTVSKRLSEEGNPLSPPHIENVFRTNTMAAYSNAQHEAISHPIVSDAFPYVGYTATHDARVREEHKELESLGLQGTNIYRADDPTFLAFRPPWSYNSIAEGELVTTSRGYVPIQNVSVGDVVLTHKGNWRPVLGTSTREGPSKIVSINTKTGSIRLTAEHHVSTEFGWIKASELNIGDCVYQNKEVSSLDLTQLEINNSIQTKGLSYTSIPLLVGVPTDFLNFDTYSQRRNVEIQPVWNSTLVKHKLKPIASKLISDYSFPSAHIDPRVGMSIGVKPISSFPRRRSLFSNFGSVSDQKDFVDFAEPLLPFGMSLIVFPVSLPPSSDFNPKMLEQSNDCSSLQSRLSTNISNTNIPNNVRIDPSFPSSFQFIEFSHTSIKVCSHSIRLLSHPVLQMDLEPITEIQIQLYQGKVYDLSVAEDESFNVGKIAVSNCRCSWYPQTVEQASRKGVEEAKQWLDRAKGRAKEKGGTYHQYLNEVKPVEPKFVEPPPFKPDPNFQRNKV